MNNAVSESRELLEALKPGLFGENIRIAIERGGVVHLDPALVFMGIPYDPIDQDHEHTFYVLFVGGEGLAAGVQADYLRGLGYTHVVWTREVKAYGKQEPQKHTLTRFARLTQVLNRHHG